MPKKVSYKAGGSGGFFKAPAGGHPAIIVGVAELGTEMKTYKEGDTPKAVEEIQITFEIEAEQEIYDSEKGELTGKMEDKIGLISQSYTAVISDKSKLGKVITAVYDVKSVKEIKEFSLDQLIGQKCFIEVEMKGKEKNFETVASVSSYNKKVNYHDQVQAKFYFGMEDADDFIEETLEDKNIFKPWVRDRIKASPEYRELHEKYGLEMPKTLDEQEEDLEKEAETRKAEQVKADAEPTVSEEEVGEIFGNEEPKTTTIAREKAKAKEEEKIEEVEESAFE